MTDEDTPPLLNESSSADMREKILALMNRRTNMAISQGFMIGFLFGLTVGILLVRRN